MSSRLDEILAKLDHGTKSASILEMAANDNLPTKLDYSGIVSLEPPMTLPSSVPPMSDDSLRSWIATLDYDSWKDYQNGLDSFLGSPLDNLPFDIPE